MFILVPRNWSTVSDKSCVSHAKHKFHQSEIKSHFLHDLVCPRTAWNCRNKFGVAQKEMADWSLLYLIKRFSATRWILELKHSFQTMFCDPYFFLGACLCMWQIITFYKVTIWPSHWGSKSQWRLGEVSIKFDHCSKYCYFQHLPTLPGNKMLEDFFKKVKGT